MASPLDETLQTDYFKAQNGVHHPFVAVVQVKLFVSKFDTYPKMSYHTCRMRYGESIPINERVATFMERLNAFRQKQGLDPMVIES